MVPRALVLIPCCKEKEESRPDCPAMEPLAGITALRTRLFELLRATRDLAAKHGNRDGLLAAVAAETRACDLYQGQAYQAMRDVWSRPDIDIVIVSAAYGLVRTGEYLRNYDLRMGDKLLTGQRVYRYWQDARLPNILERYVCEHSISHVWSLLTDSMPGYPYHQVFERYWKRAPHLGQRCFHVKVFNSRGKSAGSGTGQKRGQWLASVLRSRPKMLTQDAPEYHHIDAASDYYFDYAECDR